MTEIQIDKIDAARDNTRGKITSKAVSDLAASMKSVGLINAVTLRKKGDRFEVIAGHRRIEAAKAAGWKKIPADIIEADDRTAQTMRIVENLERQDLTPVEEADAIQKLAELGFTDEQAAAQLGRSAAFVARRSRISTLTPKWKKAFTNGDFAAWPVEAMELIARYPAEAQDTLLADMPDWATQSLDQLRRYLGDRDSLLAAAPWKLADDELDQKAGPCNTCPKRSSCQPLLFDLESKKKDKGDRCLDRPCWNRKMRAFVEQKIAELDNCRLITREWYLRIDHPYGNLGTILSREEYDLSTKKDGGMPAIVVDGPEIGHIKYITKKGRKKARAVAGSDKQAAQGLTDADRWVRLDARRALHRANVVKEYLKSDENCRPVHLDALPEDGRMFWFLSLFAAFGFEPGSLYTQTAWPFNRNVHGVEKALAMPCDELLALLWTQARKELTKYVNGIAFNGSTALEREYETKEVVLWLGLDWAMLTDESEKEIPVPKVLEGKSRRVAAKGQR